MSKFNLYKIEKSKQIDLVTKITKYSGLTLTKKEVINGLNFDFYFSSSPDPTQIWWIDLYREWIGNNENIYNTLYYAIFLVYSEDFCYALSFGKSHFYLKNYCEEEFGLNLAERIVNKDSIKTKSSKFYKSRKNKTISSFVGNSDMDYDTGESIHYIKANTIDKNIWGKSVSCGSSIQFNIELNQEQLSEFIYKIEDIIKSDAIFEIPRTTPVTDEKEIKRLDEKLCNNIQQTNSTNLEIEDISLSGINFIFVGENEYELYHKEYGSYKRGGDLNIEVFVFFIKKYNIPVNPETINQIRIKIRTEYGGEFSRSLKECLDYTDDEKRVCLLNGKWHHFTNSYLEQLNRKIDNISIDEYNPEYDLPNNYKDLFGEVSSTYKEDYFNKTRTDNDGFILLDKKNTYINGYTIENGDLYKDEVLYFVKIGKPKTLNYVIDQAINTIKLFQNTDNYLTVGENNLTVRTVCLWIIFDDRKTEIKKLSDLKSLIFAMKLAEWKGLTDKVNFAATIKINYKK